MQADIVSSYPQVFVSRLDKEFYGNFTQVFNHIFDAKIAEEKKLPALRPTAKVLLQNLISKKDGWFFSIADMVKRVNVGKEALNNARKELVKKGYLKVIKFMDLKTGKFIGSKYFISECAEFLEENKKLEEKKSICHIEKVNAESFDISAFLPRSGNALLVNAEAGKKDTINTNSINNNLNSNDEILKNFSEESELNVVIKENNKDNCLTLNKDDLSTEGRKDVGTGEELKVPPVPPPAEPTKYDKFKKQIKQMFSKGFTPPAPEEQELINAFMSATNHDNENLGFELVPVLKLIRNPEISKEVIEHELKYAKWRVDKSGKAVKAGYITKLIYEGQMTVPKLYDKEKEQEELKANSILYTAAVKIWDSKQTNINNQTAAMIIVNNEIRSLLLRNKIDEIKEKISKTKQVIDLNIILTKNLMEILPSEVLE